MAKRTGPLSAEERAVFRRWVQSRPAFRPGLDPRAGTTDRRLQQDSLREVGGSITVRGVFQTVPMLIGRWISLGRPDRPGRRARPVLSPLYQGGRPHRPSSGAAT